MATTGDKLGNETESRGLLSVESLDHVTIVVADLAATRRFYVDVLGMQEVSRPAFVFAGQWFQAGPTLIHTILATDLTGPPSGTFPQSTRATHFAFLVADTDAAYTRLIAAGVEVLVPPKARPDGAAQLFLHDPDGHLVELCSPPAAS